jgi:hypothetical protein
MAETYTYLGMYLCTYAYAKYLPLIHAIYQVYWLKLREKTCSHIQRPNRVLKYTYIVRPVKMWTFLGMCTPTASHLHREFSHFKMLPFQHEFCVYVYVVQDQRSTVFCIVIKASEK